MYHIIYNPSSGQKKTKKAAEEVMLALKQAGHNAVFHPTEWKGHCTEIVREINASPEPQKVLIIGGDGTFSEALNGVTNFESITFGLIPCGTGNDFAKKLSLPKKPKKAVARILKGAVNRIDYLDLGSRRCLNVCGLGMDVDVLVKYASMKHFRGKIKYYLSLFYVLTHFKPHRVRYTVNGVENEQDVFMVGVCNGSYIGGGMAIAPGSNVKDGVLDLVVIDNIKRSKLLFRLIAFLRGKIDKQPCTHTFRSTEAQVEVLNEGTGKIQVDGEVIDTARIDAKIVPNGLKMFL
ncbi:MAG TPA: hypothetical protein DIC18_01710 [Clostridiales bacterium]|nr:hypothetical protein [Clostridiales bacterium]